MSHSKISSKQQAANALKMQRKQAHQVSKQMSKQSKGVQSVLSDLLKECKDKEGLEFLRPYVESSGTGKQRSIFEKLNAAKNAHQQHVNRAESAQNNSVPETVSRETNNGSQSVRQDILQTAVTGGQRAAVAEINEICTASSVASVNQNDTFQLSTGGLTWSEIVKTYYPDLVEQCGGKLFGENGAIRHLKLALSECDGVDLVNSTDVPQILNLPSSINGVNINKEGVPTRVKITKQGGHTDIKEAGCK